MRRRKPCNHEKTGCSSSTSLIDGLKRFWHETLHEKWTAWVRFSSRLQLTAPLTVRGHQFSQPVVLFCRSTHVIESAGEPVSCGRVHTSRRRERFIQECIRSTTHRWALQPGVRSFSALSSLRLRMRGMSTARRGLSTHAVAVDRVQAQPLRLVGPRPQPGVDALESRVGPANVKYALSYFVIHFSSDGRLGSTQYKRYGCYPG